MDVTLACADGATIDAHKVILSSVSTYFREILKVEMCYSDWFPGFMFYFQNAPCKHPIIILKDTCKEEAQAMLEFAYTGEVSEAQNRLNKLLSFQHVIIYSNLQVNVGQELLPSLLHTARCYKIKGLDNVQTPPGLLEHKVRLLHDLDRD